MNTYFSLGLLCLVLSRPPVLLHLLSGSIPELLFLPSFRRSDLFFSDSCLDSRNSFGTLRLGLCKCLALLSLPCSFALFICVIFGDGNETPRYHFRVIVAVGESET